jgi:lipopolysaccharide/colanic/teichoic acid biosynthesis glycosyltransferase
MPNRLLDIAGAASALLLFSPILAAVALAIRLFIGRPVLFRQTRPGYLEKPFTIYKFRTMREAVDSQGLPLADGERLHRLGTFLRRTSLDELPQFWNVLQGDMSLVGPRPLLMRYLPFYTEEERTRFTVRPGITGWAQVNGRNEAGWDDRLRNDIWYVRNRSFLLNIKILWMTVVKVVRRQHVIVDAHSTMLNLDEERADLKVGRVL